MTLVIKKRGRPPKQQQIVSTPVKPDAELLSDIKERFVILGELVEGATKGTVPSLLVSGAPGVGKSTEIENTLDNSGVTYEVVSGSISPINVYKAGYRMRDKGSVLVFDDCDIIFANQESLSVLKKLCDSSTTRRVSWLKESRELKTEDEDIPTSYDFEGSVIFVTNLDLRYYIKQGSNKYVPHFEALVNRSLYLDLMIHNRQQLALWIEYIAKQGGMFLKEGIDDLDGETILNYIRINRDKFSSLSLRTVRTLIGLFKTNKSNWETRANILLLEA